MFLAVLLTGLTLSVDDPSTFAAVAPQAPAASSAAPTHRPEPAHAAAPPAGKTKCVIPADLAPSPEVDIQPDKKVAPADLPGPRFEVPGEIPIGIDAYLPPPAPHGSEVSIGTAWIDTATGAVSINGTNFSPPADDCAAGRN